MKSIKLTILILNRMINHVNWEAFPCQTGFIILPTTSSKTPTCNDESWDFGQSHPHVLQCPSVYQVPSLLPGGLWPRQSDQGGGLPASVSHRFPMFFHVFEGGLQEHLEHPLLRQVIFGDYERWPMQGMELPCSANHGTSQSSYWCIWGYYLSMCFNQRNHLQE